MQAIRFMRLPFIATGFQVTEGNMEVVAQWCEGHVIESTRGRFIRVPVNNARKAWHTEAFVNMYVIKSWHNDRYSFKVYDEERLLSMFTRLPDEFALPPGEEIDYNDDEDDDDADGGTIVITELVPEMCACHSHGRANDSTNNVRTLPTQPTQSARKATPATVQLRRASI